MIAATIPYLSRDNFWLNSVQKQILSSQVSDKIEVKISPESWSEPPIKRRESSYSTIECAEIGLGRFGPKREKKDDAVSKSYQRRQDSLAVSAAHSAHRGNLGVG